MVKEKLVIISLALLLIIQPLTFGNGFAQIPEKHSNPALDFDKRIIKTSQDTDKLFSKFGDSARVIVELNIPNYAPEATLKTPQEKTDQRSRILGAQDVLLKSLKGEKIENVKKLKTAPYLAMTVDRKTLDKLLATPTIKSIREDTLLKPSLAFSIPYVGADVAHLDGDTGSGRAVAILDTGVDSAHPFFGGRVTTEACFSTTDTTPPFTFSSACPSGADVQIGPGSAAPCGVPGCEHGTHVAGIAAGTGGVAPDAEIVAIQVFSEFSGSICAPDPTCALAFTSDIIAGLDHVLTLKTGGMAIDAANLSLGGGLSSTECPGEPEEPSILALKAAGVATIVASGNEASKSSISFPACVPAAISVGATSAGRPGFPPPDTIAGFSNSYSFLDLLGPGHGVESSVPGGIFDIYSGTSMSTPTVTGSFAVLRAIAPAMSVDTLESILETTGVDLTDVNGVTTPRINLAEATFAVDLEATCGPLASYDAVIFGTPGPDVLVATVKSVVVGDAGDDRIFGSPFDDCLLGMEGNDGISGAGGNDIIVGFDGNDQIKGGEGNDAIFGGFGMDRISGGPGTDTIDGEGDADSIKGDQDDDVLTGGSGDDRISGGLGNDSISGEAGSDQITGRIGNDTIACGLGVDNAVGDDGMPATNPADVDVLNPDCEIASIY
jgi:hypothetical protein